MSGPTEGAGADVANSPARPSRRQQRAPEQPFARARIPIARVVRIGDLCDGDAGRGHGRAQACARLAPGERRSEEHTSELQSLMRISYAVFCLKKKTKTNT